MADCQRRGYRHEDLLCELTTKRFQNGRGQRMSAALFLAWWACYNTAGMAGEILLMIEGCPHALMNTEYDPWTKL